MAKLAKEKFLVLAAEDLRDRGLSLQISISRKERMHFIGSVSDGQELLGCIKGEGKYGDRERYPVPDPMLLEVTMPRKDGFEVLDWLRGQPFDDVVVVILSEKEKVQGINKPMSVGGDSSRPKGGSPFTRRKLVKLLEEYLSTK